MKHINNIITNKIFKDLCIGDGFYYQKVPYMKIPTTMIKLKAETENLFKRNAINLRTGVPDCFANDTILDPNYIPVITWEQT